MVAGGIEAAKDLEAVVVQIYLAGSGKVMKLVNFHSVHTAVLVEKGGNSL